MGTVVYVPLMADMRIPASEHTNHDCLNVSVHKTDVGLLPMEADRWGIRDFPLNARVGRRESRKAIEH